LIRAAVSASVARNKEVHLRAVVVCVVCSALMLGSAAADAGAASCFGFPADIVGTAGNDRLVGTRGWDVIVAFGGSDTIRGLDGNDRICAGSGNDLILAGKSDAPDWYDLVSAGTGRDRIYGGPGQDTIQDGEGADEVFAGPGLDRIGGERRASSGDDVVFLGSDGGIVLDGLGNDVYHGERGGSWFEFDGGGFDRFFGGGDDFLSWRGEVDIRINLTTGNVVRLTDDFLRARVFSINDAEVVGEGMDTLIGNSASNRLFGDFGDDRLLGRDGDDFLFGGFGVDVLDGGDGTDDCDGEVGETVLNCEA
jgi:Ca2+-binding RTX toxin-like protein